MRMIFCVGNTAEEYNDEDAETTQIIGNDTWRIVQRNRAELALRESLEHHVAY